MAVTGANWLPKKLTRIGLGSGTSIIITSLALIALVLEPATEAETVEMFRRPQIANDAGRKARAGECVTGGDLIQNSGSFDRELFGARRQACNCCLWFCATKNPPALVGGGVKFGHTFDLSLGRATKAT